MTDTNHAIANAQCWVETISQGVTALDRLEAIAGSTEEFDGETFEDSDALRERLLEMPLAIEMRDGCRPAGDASLNDGDQEYRILLTMGGPALRITGDLGAHGEPETARLEYQDWGTPWTDYTLAKAEAARVLTFTSLFYFES